ncbi:MAG: hypothetical protein Q9166_007560 [cf. Caloplaca sp. 2 TL-2023]
MTDSTRVPDVINPIAALKLVEDRWGDLRLLFAGRGPYLDAFDHQHGRLISTTRIFKTQAIHGIAIDVSNGRRLSSTVVGILIWGGRRVRRALLHLGMGAELMVHTELESELRLDDWILDGTFNLAKTSTPNRSSRKNDAVVVTTHNVAFAIPRHITPRRITSGPDSMLYSAHIDWSTRETVLIASGTVFGEIFVWSFPANAMRADALSSCSVILHFRFTGHEGSVFGVRISSQLPELGLDNGQRLLASCSDDRTIRLWDISDLHRPIPGGAIGTGDASPTPSNGCVAMNMGHASRIWDVRFLESGDRVDVLSFGEDGTAQTWQLSGKVSKSSSPELPDPNVLSMVRQQSYAYHSGKNIWASALVRQPDGRHTVCTGGADGRIASYDVLKECESGDREVLTCAWTMNDVDVQLEEKEALFAKNATRSDLLPKKTICEHIFDALAGTWTIEREIRSALPTYPCGIFNGEAQLERRPQTDPEYDKEYLYVENGSFTTDQGSTFPATRRYVYRYERATDTLTAWFVKTEDNTGVDYLFHALRFVGHDGLSNNDNVPVNGVVKASSYHLCSEDHYEPDYVFHLEENRLQDWELAYQVKGPQKDYVTKTYYARKECENHSHPISIGEEESRDRKVKRQRLSSDPLTEKDDFRSYVFLTDASFLVTTAQGRVLLASLPSFARCNEESERDDIDASTIRWELVGQYEALKLSSITARGVSHQRRGLRGESSDKDCTDMGKFKHHNGIGETNKKNAGQRDVLMSGSDGTIYVNSYDGGTNKILPFIGLERKVAFLYAQGYFILAVCLGISVAVVYQIDVDGHCGNDIICLPIQLTLPADFVVTSACFLQELRVLMLGARNGAVAFYEVHAGDEGTATEACSVLPDIHGKDAITVLQCLPDQQVGQPFHVLTAGRDGHYAVHTVLKSIIDDAAQTVLVKLHTVHRSTAPFGPNIEGAAFDEQTHDLLLWGFRSKNFVAWNASKDIETMNIDCGGAHRNWSYNPRSNGSGGGILVWTKASVCNVYSQSSASHRVFSPGGHGREIKTLALSPALATLPDGSKAKYIATGSEDTAIRIWSYSLLVGELENGFRCLGIFRKHTTGIQQLRWSPDGSLLFSAAGCEEFFVWQVQPVPFLGIGAVCEAICPKVAEDGDLRIMDFALVEFPRYYKDKANPPTEYYLISIVYSDSSIRLYRYPSTHVGRSFELLQTGAYTTHCLTAAAYLLPNNNSVLCTAASDGHVAFWPFKPLLQQPQDSPPKELHYYYSVPVHQNSIKSMFTIPLSALDVLIITGGDDGAIGITRRMFPSMQLYPVTKTLVIPKAHAAAINAVAYLRITSSRLRQGEQTHTFVSSGNDQRVKTWAVSVKIDNKLSGRYKAAELVKVLDGVIKNVDVRMLRDQYTCVADVSAVSRMEMEMGLGVMVAGIGMEVLGDVD